MFLENISCWHCHRLCVSSLVKVYKTWAVFQKCSASQFSKQGITKPHMVFWCFVSLFQCFAFSLFSNVP